MRNEDLTPADIIAALDRIDQEAAALAAEIKRMIPADAIRDDPTWEAHTFIGGAGASAARAARAMRRAIGRPGRAQKGSDR